MFRQLKRAGAGERCQAMQTGHLRCRALVVPPVPPVPPVSPMWDIPYQSTHRKLMLEMYGYVVRYSNL